MEGSKVMKEDIPPLRTLNRHEVADINQSAAAPTTPTHLSYPTGKHSCPRGRYI